MTEQDGNPGDPTDVGFPFSNPTSKKCVFIGAYARNVGMSGL